MLGGGAVEADGDDDGAVGAAQADHPDLVGWPPERAERSGVDLDDEGFGFGADGEGSSVAGSGAGELGDGFLGAGVVDEALAVSGGGHEGGGGGVVEGAGQPVGVAVESGGGVVCDERVGRDLRG